METGRIAIIKLTKIFIFIIFMHKYNMIRRQCVKLKAQTHLNMPIVYSLCTIVWISLQKYFQLFHIETTFIINLLRSSLILSCQHEGLSFTWSISGHHHPHHPWPSPSSFSSAPPASSCEPHHELLQLQIFLLVFYLKEFSWRPSCCSSLVQVSEMVSNVNLSKFFTKVNTFH